MSYTVTYNKRIKGGKLLQLWFIETFENRCKSEYFNIEREYFGEGIPKEEMIEINIDEFKELAAQYTCLIYNESSEPSSSHNSE